MRWFLDTEFHEDGRTIDLISIALVNERGEEYYAVSNEFDEARCSDWVKEHVLSKLPSRETWKPRRVIAAEIAALVLRDPPEFWAYYSAYDWVALCQLYGRMIDLPAGFPMWCQDLKQLMDDHGIERKDLPPCESEHDALADARWLRSALGQMEADFAL